MSTFRHLSRELALQALFLFTFQKGTQLTQEQAFSYTAQEFAKSLPSLDFAENIFKGVIEHKSQLDHLIETYAPEWPLDKIAYIDLIVLEIGLFELIHSQEEVPAVVAINEAVELAKTYSDKGSSRFVNGVLHKHAQEAGNIPKKQ